MNNPIVSIIIPVYNVENYLTQCLDSVILQTYEFLEIILSTIIETQKLLVKKIDQLARYEEKLDQKLAALSVTDKLTQDIYYILLQAALFKGDGATVEQLVATTGKSRNTIDARLATLPKEHLLKITSTKPYRYKLNTLMLK